MPMIELTEYTTGRPMVIATDHIVGIRQGGRATLIERQKPAGSLEALGDVETIIALYWATVEPPAATSYRPSATDDGGLTMRLSDPGPGASPTCADRLLSYVISGDETAGAPDVATELEEWRGFALELDSLLAYHLPGPVTEPEPLIDAVRRMVRATRDEGYAQALAQALSDRSPSVFPPISEVDE